VLQKGNPLGCKVAFGSSVRFVESQLKPAHPVRELRFDRPEQYEVLLRGRELTNLHAHDRPLVFPSVIATIAFVSSTDAMQVTRLLSPLLELFILLAAGLLFHLCTRGTVATIAVIYCLGSNLRWMRRVSQERELY
jgi:hypothetical protein